MRKARKPQSGDKDAVLAALKQQALRGGQGRVAAARSWLDHTEGRPVQKQPQNELNISEDTLKRCVAIAEKLAAKCMHCGKPVGMASSVTEPHGEDVGGTFQAYEPQPEPRRAEEPDAEKPALMRQPRTVIENPDPLHDRRGEVPRL